MPRSLHPRGQHRIRAPARGFTLIELLVSMALGALLLSGLANSARVFEESVRHVRAEDDHRLEDALVGITDAIRTAWLVERPSPSRLEVTDAFGRMTIFQKIATSLKVTRPSGVRGELLSGVAAVTFDVATTRRYAEATPRVRYETFWTSPVTTGATTPLTIHGGEALAIGFNLQTSAPAAVNTIAEIQEQVLDASLDRLVVALSFFDGSPLEFCHLHATGPPHDSSHASGTTSLSVELYEARVPEDPRPYGASLATAGLPTSSLPHATYSWIDLSTSIGVTPPEVIDPPSGIAWGWWASHPQVALAVTPPHAIFSPIDLVPMDQTIRPGRAYALVLRVAGVDYVTAEANALPSIAGSNVAFRAAGATSFAPLAMTVPFRLEGMRRCTQTTAHDVVSRVTVTIAMQDGEVLSGSALVPAQTSASDPWTGPVPGSLPALQLAGQ